MKKIFSILIALAMTITLASAQTKTVEHAGLFENTYVTLSGGAVTNTQFQNMTKDNWYKLGGIADLELGKYVTPVIGFSVDGLAFLGTTNSYTLVDESAVLGNVKLDFSNWLLGYKGKPYLLDVVGVLGYGWGHDYVASSYGQYRTTADPVIVDGQSVEVRGLNGVATDKNYTVYRTGAEFNFNLGKSRAWQINLKPGVIWMHKLAGDYVSTPFLTGGRDARAYVTLGTTYKFGSKSKGHNFRLCPYSVTKADYDALKKQYNDLANREPEVREVVKTVTETKEVVKTETRVLVGSTVITFDIGSCALSTVERQKVGMFAESLDNDTLVQIVGSADSGTGSETRNFALAQNRANVVKNVLVNDYGVNPDRISVNTKLDATANTETSRSAILTLSVE